MCVIRIQTRYTIRSQYADCWFGVFIRKRTIFSFHDYFAHHGWVIAHIEKHNFQ